MSSIFSPTELAAMERHDDFTQKEVPDDYIPSPEDVAGLIAEIAEEKNLPIVVLGGAGDDTSPVSQMADALRFSGQRFLHTDHLECLVRAVYFVGVPDELYRSYEFAQGSVVVDPLNQTPDQPGVEKL